MGEKVLIMDPRGLLGLSVQVLGQVVEVLRACGPETMVIEAVERSAERRGSDRDVLAAATLASVRELASKGLLTVAT
jgi:hypothetical protein